MSSLGWFAGYTGRMADHPFHHGNLRTALLDEAEKSLRTKGVDQLSLREVARDIGVSHGAPRSHFIDKKALLDALAERGFRSLAAAMRIAADSGTDYANSLRECGRAYLEFAVSNSALFDLMFAAKLDEPPAELLEAAEGLFGTISDIMNAGVRAGAFPERQIGRLTLLMSATMQGISTFVGAGRVSATQGVQLIDDAIDMFLRRPLG
jgi:AcrR family transcriptional regulator